MSAQGVVYAAGLLIRDQNLHLDFRKSALQQTLLLKSLHNFNLIELKRIECVSSDCLPASSVLHQSLNIAHGDNWICL